jgi:hypothetical protein
VVEYFVRYYKNSEGSTEWYSNISLPVTKGSTSKNLNGKAIIYQQSSGMHFQDVCLRLYFPPITFLVLVVV